MRNEFKRRRYYTRARKIPYTAMFENAFNKSNNIILGRVSIAAMLNVVSPEV